MGAFGSGVRGSGLSRRTLPALVALMGLPGLTMLMGLVGLAALVALDGLGGLLLAGVHGLLVRLLLPPEAPNIDGREPWPAM